MIDNLELASGRFALGGDPGDDTLRASQGCPRSTVEFYLMSRPIAVDLFAGAGGLSLGLEQAGYEVAAAVEYDPIHAAVHEYNFANATTFCRDVATMTGDEIRAKSSIGDQEIHVVAGGPPCQGVSLIGKRALDDPRNALLSEYARLVAELRPRYFIMENVAGLTVGGHRRLLDEVIALTQDAGYNVVLPYRVLQASDFGVPQSRRRLFLLGARADAPLPSYPESTHRGRSAKGTPVTHGSLPLGPSVRDALGDLPDADAYSELLDGDSVKARFGKASEYAAPLRGLVQSINDFSHPRRFERTMLTSSTRTVHTRASIERFATTKPGTTEAISRFLRLHPEGVCNTLRAGTASDRGAYTAPRPIHPTLPRVITVREAARLHGYPDWFRFHVTKWNGFREIGNSVPPLLGRAVAAQLLAADSTAPTHGSEIRRGSERLLSLTASAAEAHFGITERVIPHRDRKVG